MCVKKRQTGAGLYVIEMDRRKISVGERRRTVMPGKSQARSGSRPQAGRLAGLVADAERWPREGEGDGQVSKLVRELC